jgi:hypothetical protein
MEALLDVALVVLVIGCCLAGDRTSLAKEPGLELGASMIGG